MEVHQDQSGIETRRAIVESMLDGFWMTDAEGRLLDVNQAYATMSGFSRSELLTLSIADLEAGESPEETAARLCTVIEHGCDRFVTRHRRKDGSELSVEASFSLVNGGEARIACFIRDISGCQLLDPGRQASEERFQSTFEQAAVGIAHVDLTGAWLCVNQKLCEIVGYSRDELAGLTFQDITHPDDLSVDVALVEQVLEGELSTYSMEKRYLCKDGSEVWVELTVSLVRTSAGEPEYFISVVEDISDRKRTEEALGRSLRELEIRNRVAEVFLTTADDEMYSRVLEIVLEALDSRFGVFGFIDSVGDLVVPTMTRHIWDQCNVPDKNIVFPRETWGESIWPTAIRRKKTLFSNRRSALTPEGHIPVDRNIAAPLVHRGDVVGLLQVANKADDYTATDVELLETLARMIAPVLGARLDRELQETFRRQAEDDLREHRDQLEREVEKRTAALRASELRHRQIAEMVSDFVFQISLSAAGDQTLEWITGGFTRITGLTWDTVNNPDIWAGGAHPEDLDDLHRFLDAVAAGEERVIEVRFIVKTDRLVWLSLRGRPQREVGRVASILGSGTDITPRKEAEHRLNRAQHVARMGFLDWTLGSDELYWSDEVFTLYGVDRGGPPPTLEATIGMVHPDDRDAATASLEQAIRGVADHDLDHRVVRPDGSEIWVHAQAEVKRDRAGAAVGLLGTVVDITERKLVEDELRQRTAELEAANRDLESFSYSVSHDLRSPLRGIDGYSKILIDDYQAVLDDDGRLMLEQVRSSAKEMAELIDGLLEFSRLGRRELKWEAVDVAAAARRAFIELERAHDHRRLRLEVDGVPPAYGDPTMVLEVLRNLLGNAVKFTAQRELGVVEVWGEPGDVLHTYHVRDNGAGFDMLYADKLFDVFQRLHRAEEFEGTGIGLALVHRIIQRHGGRVWGEGEVGQGATFTFTLPAGKE